MIRAFFILFLALALCAGIPASSQPQQQGMSFTEREKGLTLLVALRGFEEAAANLDGLLASNTAPISRREAILSRILLYGLAGEALGFSERDNPKVETLRGGLSAETDAQSAESDFYVASYFVLSNQLGRAVPYLNKVATETASDALEYRILALYHLSAAHLFVHDIDSARAVARLADELVLTAPPELKDQVFCLQVANAQNIAAALGEPAALGAAWADAKRYVEIVEKQGGVEVVFPITFARQLARAGLKDQAKDARQTYDRAIRRYFQQAGLAWNTQTKSCLDALFVIDPIGAIAERDFEKRYDECSEAAGSTFERIGVGPLIRSWAGDVFAEKGQHAKAAQLYESALRRQETVRGSFDVESRGGFFSGAWSEPALGAIRARAALAADKANFFSGADFFQTVAAMERVRARQLGDYRGLDQALAPEQISAFAAGLTPGTVVLAFSQQKDRLISVAFSGQRTGIHVKSITASALASDVGDVRARLLSGIWTAEETAADMGQLFLPLLGDNVALLADARRIIVLPDGVLTTLPFGLFKLPSREGLLIDQAQVSYAPSIALLRQAGGPVSTSRLMAWGDPTMPDLPPAVGVHGAMSDPRGPVRNGVLAALPFASAELQGVKTAFGSDSVVRPGVESTEAALKRADLTSFRYLLFATHGLVADEFPGLMESALVLGAGDGEDGYLFASEAQSLKLNAELTVLSACNTGSGRIELGEGVYGLARSFIVAGSRSVLVSLWPVNDRATSELIVEFFKEIRTGAAPEQALRTASQTIRRQHAEPYFWASFVLISTRS